MDDPGGAGGVDELVVSLGETPIGTAHGDASRGGVDLLDAVMDVDVDVLAGELLRGADDELVEARDVSRDVIGLPACRVAHPVRLLEDGDAKLVGGTASAGLACRGHPGGIAADDDEAFGHLFFRNREVLGVAVSRRRALSSARAFS